uniref:Protein kinase domain-containing protein n=1 Tax=Panagrellus redivivus TaxID=6233 RepID=A0A7E4UPQ6_PANRE
MGNYKSRPALACADEIKKRISEGYVLIRSRLNDESRTRVECLNPLQAACFHGEDIQAFRALLTDAQINLDVKSSPKELSLIHLICIGTSSSQEQCDKIICLLDRCGDDDARRRSLLHNTTRSGFSPLHIAIYKNDKRVVEKLLKAGADPNVFRETVPPPLHLAAMIGNVDIIDALVKNGADLHKPDFAQFSALHCATYFGHDTAVRALLLSGAEPNASGAVHDRPLHIAASKTQFTIVNILLQGGADPSLTDDEGNTTLHFAAKVGHSNIINLLLKKCENKRELVMQANIYGDTPMHTACYTGRLDAAKQILAAAGSTILNKENMFSETPFLAACTAGKNTELIAFLLRQPGANPNYQGKDGHTALHSACYHGNIRVVEYLLNNGADQSLTARAVENPLTQGTLPPENGYPTITSTMFALTRLDSGGSIGDSSRSSTHSIADEQTPILWAYERGHDEIVAMLKRHANKRMDSDVCSEYSSGDSSYTPLPSPIGRLRSITKEKADILLLRANLKRVCHLALPDIDLLNVIGSGSFGKVYEGVYKGKTVAVKRYKAVAFGSKTEVDMFCREVSILCRLKHPNVIAFVGACLDDPSQFAIVTEFIAGGSLYRLLHVEKRVFEMMLKLCIAVDVARGMRYLHELTVEPVIHRDLNSHNILLHSNGRAVVADFGESRFMAHHEEDNLTKQPGNLRWMAPEVFTQSCRYDHKVDVFSYALVIWEIHAAELPFSSLKPAAAAAEMAYKKSRPELPTSATPQFPAHVLKMVKNAWNPNPDMRPDFCQILNELEPHIIPDDQRNFNVGDSRGIDGMDRMSATYDTEEEAEFSVDQMNTVSRLKSQWEQQSNGPGNNVAPCLNNAKPNLLSPKRQTIDNLRTRLDNHGYVSHAARSINAVKSAVQLRDSLILARSSNVAARQSVFKEPDEQIKTLTTAECSNRAQTTEVWRR